LQYGFIGFFKIAFQKAGRKISLITLHARENVRVVSDNFFYRNKKQSDVMYAFYDLQVSPPTFDILKFILFAEKARVDAGCESLHIIIVPGPDAGFRIGNLESYIRDGAMNYDNEALEWRLRNILVPCCWLMPTCKNLTVSKSREEIQSLESTLVKNIFPSGYKVKSPKEQYSLRYINEAVSNGANLPSIQATPWARNVVMDWITKNAGNRKVITITLRESKYELPRNSNLDAWGAFARNLDNNLYYPVIIRDTEVGLEPLPSQLNGLVIFHEAPWNIEIRVALYELSYLNMSVNNGPAALCVFNELIRYLRFKMVTSVGATTERHFRVHGLEPGSQFRFAKPYQRIVWEDDSYDVLVKEFEKMCTVISQA